MKDSQITACICAGLATLCTACHPVPRAEHVEPVTAILGAFEREVTLLEDQVAQRREHQIEQGEIALQDSLQQYERGMALIKHCRTILKQAEERIEKITKEQEPQESSDQAGET